MQNTITISSSVQNLQFNIIYAKCRVERANLTTISFWFETEKKQITLDGDSIKARVLIYMYREIASFTSLSEAFSNFGVLPGESVLTLLDHEELCDVTVTHFQPSDDNLKVIIKARTPELFMEGDAPLVITIESEQPVIFA